MIWRLFYKHLVAIIFYMFYLWIFISSAMREFEYKRIIAANGGKWPYGVREDGLLIFLFAFMFFIVSCGYAIAAKENKFYLWLIAAIAGPIVIIVAID